MIITFNKRTSPKAMGNGEANLELIRITERYLNELLTHRGYLYLNQVYEELGVKWDVEKTNLCKIRNELNNATITFEILGQCDDEVIISVN